MRKSSFFILAVVAILLHPDARKHVIQTVKTGLESAMFVSWPYTDRVSVQQLSFDVDNWDGSLNGFKVVQVSDLHSHEYNGALISNVIKKANEQNADLILLTGDFIMFESDPMDALSVKLSTLKAKYGVYASLGNHDSEKEGSRPVVIEKLTKVGIKVLENEAISLLNGKFTLVGLGDIERDVFSPHTVFPNHVNHQHPVLVMSHNPDTAEALRNYKADIIFSGHTHGGTVRLPWIGSIYPIFARITALVPPSLRKFVPYSYYATVVEHLEWIEGVHELQRANSDSRNILTVSRGIGSHPNGFRIFCEPEISVITINSRKT